MLVPERQGLRRYDRISATFFASLIPSDVSCALCKIEGHILGLVKLVMAMASKNQAFVRAHVYRSIGER